MTPEQEQIKALEIQMEELTRFMRSFENAGQVSPLVAQTIRKIVGATTLAGLDDVSLSSPSNGEVLEYLNGIWVNATDNT